MWQLFILDLVCIWIISSYYRLGLHPDWFGFVMATMVVVNSLFAFFYGFKYREALSL